MTVSVKKLLNSVDSSAAPAHVLGICCCVFASHLEKRCTDFLKCGILWVVLQFFSDCSAVLPWCKPTSPWTWPCVGQMSTCVLLPLAWVLQGRKAGFISALIDSVVYVNQTPLPVPDSKVYRPPQGRRLISPDFSLAWDHGTIQSWFTYDVRPAFRYRIPSGVKNEDKGLRTLKRRESLPLNCCQGKHRNSLII